MVVLVDGLLLEMEEDKIPMLILLDLSAALNSIDHEVLLIFL